MEKTPAIAGRRLFVVILEAGSHADPEGDDHRRLY